MPLGQYRSESGLPRSGTSAMMQMMAALDSHLRQVHAWLQTQPNIEVRRVEYHSLIEDPNGESDAINSFLDMSLDAAIMAQQVDPSLRRQRGG